MIYISSTPLCISKIINNWWQVCTPNQHPHNNILQVCGARKYACLVWIWPADNFHHHPRTSIKINKLWSNQCQSNIIQQHMNKFKLGDWTQNHSRISDGVLILHNYCNHSQNWVKYLQENQTCNDIVWKWQVCYF